MKNPLEGFIERKPEMRPALNVGALIDIPTGKWRVGMKGESLLDGGRTHITAVGGRGNMHKSSVSHYIELMTLYRYPPSVSSPYDTENNADITRYKMLTKGANINLDDVLTYNSSRFLLTDKTVMLGDVWYRKIKDSLENRSKDKSNWIKTPFRGHTGKAFEVMIPIGAEVDSFSMFTTSSVEEMTDKHDVGDSKRNTQYLKDGAAKTQLMNELSTFAPSTGSYFTLTAHIGDKIEMDPYAPDPKKLAMLKKGSAFKNVPEKFTFLTENCWYCANLSVLKNASTKAPEFPRDSNDNIKGDTDLQLLTLMNLRGKGGPSGLPIQVIVSQNEGILPTLSEFYNCKVNKFGIGGNDRNYHMELYPGCNLSRTTVRNKIDKDSRLARAINITSEILQMQQIMHHLPDETFCSMAELYKDLKEKGYDWDRLLDTRGWWTFNQYEHELPFLSSMDLLNMRMGLYHPYWYGELKGK